MNSSLSDEKPVSDEEPVPIVSQFSDRKNQIQTEEPVFRQKNQFPDRRTSIALVLISDAKVLLFSFAAKLNRRVT